MLLRPWHFKTQSSGSNNQLQNNFYIESGFYWNIYWDSTQFKYMIPFQKHPSKDAQVSSIILTHKWFWLNWALRTVRTVQTVRKRFTVRGPTNIWRTLTYRWKKGFLFHNLGPYWSCTWPPGGNCWFYKICWKNIWKKLYQVFFYYVFIT